MFEWLLWLRAPRLKEEEEEGEETDMCPISPGEVIVGRGPPNMREGGGGRMEEETPGLKPLPNNVDEADECGDSAEEEEEEECPPRIEW